MRFNIVPYWRFPFTFSHSTSPPSDVSFCRNRNLSLVYVYASFAFQYTLKLNSFSNMIYVLLKQSNALRIYEKFKEDLFGVGENSFQRSSIPRQPVCKVSFLQKVWQAIKGRTEDFQEIFFQCYKPISFNRILLQKLL